MLWSMKPGVDVSRGLSVLCDATVARVAIANPAHAPYGRAAKAALVKADVWREIERKIVLGENVAQTAQFIETRHVDAGLFALSVIRRTRGEGSYFELPLIRILEWIRALSSPNAGRRMVMRAPFWFPANAAARATFEGTGFEILP